MELAGGISKEDLNLFLQEADEQLQLLDEDIIKLEKNAGNAELLQEIFRAAHTLKGSSAMIGHQRLSDLAHAMENVFDNIRKGSLEVSSRLVDALLHGLDVMRELRDELVETDAKPVNIKEAVTRLTAVMQPARHSRKHNSNDVSIQLSPEERKTLEKHLQEGKQGYRIKVKISQESGWASVRCFQIIQALGSFVEIIASIPTQEEIEQEKAGNLYYAIAVSAKSSDAIQKALKDIPDLDGIEIFEFQERRNTVSNDAGAADEPFLRRKDDIKLGQTVRVDVKRLDTLMEQVGELVINRNQISQLSRLLAEKYHDNETINALNDSVSQIDKIVSDLQQDVMSIRLLQIDIVFSTLPRLVRDLSRRENKKIDFIMDGQDTEVDRSIIEHLRDPLVHLLRNAVDHGIETPEERAAVGKPETGTIRLSAYQEQENIIIKLKDDGQGINPVKIRETAVAKGIATNDELAKMTDEETVNLIFSSGFSTNKNVTEVSGRGVGLDVVKTNIEVLNGTVNVQSEKGRGTTFTLVLPLTLAIIPALLVAVRQTICAVPLSTIVEITPFEEIEIKTVRGREVIMLRDEVLPILRMREVFGWAGQEEKEAAAKYVVVVKYSGARVGLTIDVLLDQQELVVKSLDQIIGGSHSFSGASILGDGTVVLILDVASLIKSVMTERQTSGLLALEVKSKDIQEEKDE